MNKKYKYIWSEKRSLVNAEAHIRQYIDERDIVGSTHDNSFIYARDFVIEELHLAEDNYCWLKIGQKFLRDNYLKKFFLDCENIIKNFGKFIEKINQINFDEIDSSELESIFIGSYKFHSRLRGYFKATRHEFLYMAETQLKKIISLNYESRHCQKVFEILSTLNKYDDVNKELIDWFSLVLKNRNISKEILLKHIERYPWLVANSSNFKEITDFFDEKFFVSHKKLESLFLETKQTIDKKSALEKMQLMILKKINNLNANKLSKFFQDFAFLRMKLKGFWAGSDFLYLPIYKEIAKRTNIKLGDLYESYRIDEIIKSIKLEKPALSKEEADDRKRAYVLWLRNKKLSFYSGNQAEIIINKELRFFFNKDENDQVKILKGQVACKGRAEGLAHILIPGDLLMLIEALNKFKKGEILVTAMTQPNMVPIMKKASAIITDEGGLTSHAAIIAREFNIPCLVGTHLATKFFKNGDKILVDANNGFVKKLQ